MDKISYDAFIGPVDFSDRETPEAGDGVALQRNRGSVKAFGIPAWLAAGEILLVIQLETVMASWVRHFLTPLLHLTYF